MSSRLCFVLIINATTWCHRSFLLHQASANFSVLFLSYDHLSSVIKKVLDEKPHNVTGKYQVVLVLEFYLIIKTLQCHCFYFILFYFMQN